MTALAGAAARLGFGHWAARWWPASYVDGIPALEPDVLGLELAALTHWCQQLFGDFYDFDDFDGVNGVNGFNGFNGFLDFGGSGDGHDARDRFGDRPDGCAAQLIADHQAALDPLIQWWRAEPRSADTARHLESVLRLLDEAADGAGLDAQALRRLRSALEQHRPAGTTVDVGALFVRRDGYALAAGDPLGAGAG